MHAADEGGNFTSHFIADLSSPLWFSFPPSQRERCFHLGWKVGSQRRRKPIIPSGYYPGAVAAVDVVDVAADARGSFDASGRGFLWAPASEPFPPACLSGKAFSAMLRPKICSSTKAPPPLPARLPPAARKSRMPRSSPRGRRTSFCDDDAGNAIALRLWPSYPPALNNLAAVVPCKAEAERHIRRALEIDPGHPNSLYNAAVLIRYVVIQSIMCTNNNCCKAVAEVAAPTPCRCWNCA